MCVQSAEGWHCVSVSNGTSKTNHMSIENITLRQQVSESINTDSVIKVDATGCDVTSIVAQLYAMGGVEDVWSDRNGDGTWRVCGTRDGGDFHLLVTCNA